MNQGALYDESFEKAFCKDSYKGTCVRGTNIEIKEVLG
jgi:hypothetical protein